MPRVIKMAAAMLSRRFNRDLQSLSVELSQMTITHCGSIVALLLVLNEAMKQEDAQKRQRKATLPYVTQRHEYGAFHALVQELLEPVGLPFDLSECKKMQILDTNNKVIALLLCL